MSAYHRGLAQDGHANLIERLGKNQKNLSVSRWNRLLVSDHNAIKMIEFRLKAH
jgi:hypothetical protein